MTLAEDGIYAQEVIRKKCFDCILMDIQMPGMDGYETTAAIRKFEKDSGLRPHYIIAMTAHVMKGDRERCLAAGMDNYISKPFRAEALKEVLNIAAGLKPSSAGGVRTKKERDIPFAEYLDTLTDEDREDLIAAAEVFIDSTPDDIAKLEEAFAGKEYKHGYFVAHSLKSVVGFFGQEETSDLLGKLEEACEKKKEDAIQLLSEEVLDALHALLHAIEIELE